MFHGTSATQTVPLKKEHILIVEKISPKDVFSSELRFFIPNLFKTLSYLLLSHFAGFFASSINWFRVSTSVTITTGSGILTSFSVAFNILVITHPFTTFTRDPAIYSPGKSPFRSTNPSEVVDPVSAGYLAIVSDQGRYSYPARSFP